MIGLQITTDKDGKPLSSGGKQLSESGYQPPEEVKKLFMQVQTDYQVAYNLQHRPFDEFDGLSLLERARKDQQTFGAYVGAENLPVHKRWRWRGRKNTARNKLIGLLAHMIAGILTPTVFAKNDSDEEDRTTARVMQILIDQHLKDANYEMKFLYMVLSALVNPAVFVQVEYVQAMQRIKTRLDSGEVKIEMAVDELLSGLQLWSIPIDEILLADFYTNEIQRQPYIIRVRRIPWDEARKKYAGRFYTKVGGKDVDLFNFVTAGKTRVVMTGQEHQTLYDIEWTEADQNYVQELTAKYRSEDLEVTFVGGVFMGNEKDVYNTNPMTHRRFTKVNGAYTSIPVYDIAKSGFEPIDPSGRFAYYKSGAFKEFWDDATQNKMHQILVDGTYLDVIKPLFVSGVTKVDSTVMVPGNTVGIPKDAQVTPYQLGPNLSGAMVAMQKQEGDMGESTLASIMTGQTGDPREKAFTVNAAMQNAKIMLGLFSLMLADLVRQVGELTMDIIILNTTTGELDASVPEEIAMKYRTFLAKSKEHGGDITHKIVFTDKYLGRKMTEAQVRKREFELFEKAGGEGSLQRLWEVNPHAFARLHYTISIDADKMVMRSIGGDTQKKMHAFEMLTDPRVAPYTDQKAVVDYFVIEEFSDGDPDQFKKKGDINELMGGMMMGGPGAAAPPEGGPKAPAALQTAAPKARQPMPML